MSSEPVLSNEDRAILFQNRFAKGWRRLPRVKDVAARVGVNVTTLYRWPRFIDARRRLRAKGCPDNRGAHRDTVKEDRAIAFQDKFRKRSGRLPTYQQVAAPLGVNKTTPRKWPRFMAARRAIKATGCPPNRRGYPRHEKDRAIAFQDEFFKRARRLPRVKDVAARVGVNVTTLCG